MSEPNVLNFLSVLEMILDLPCSETFNHNFNLNYNSYLHEYFKLILYNN